ncbi:E3 ubiquitin/ISG15 ligase TRIM25-like isoform X1 [Lethenteron reissneri]|uniref:E3 ubiquitin/ISG15 ligase TRIM25-like isoform X1 n=1 Tax=Lethenteron reissneri TaxID=7753 RepID=UPI002AB61C20|nr:E3 ubiquitin/ISG15 ligase TRIM25-like isoform X1 [Lethenteron reissneri]
MASVVPSGSEAPGELTCPICLDAFRCPCTLSCGHSFCLECVEDAWDAAKSFSCPQCRVTFPQRPQLNKNFTLANLVEQRSATEKMATVVLCDFCNDGTTAASKTCLRCDMSYCVTHVKPHQENPKLRGHVLVDPATNPEDRKCKTHRKELEFYCRQDKSLVCTTCTIAGDHKGHDVATLEDEHKTRQKQVGEETRAVEEKRREVEESVRRMEAARRDVQGHLEETRRTGRVTAAPLSAPSQEDIASLKVLETTAVKLLYGCSPTLDTNSAHNYLQISSDLKTMTWTDASQGRPNHPHRFNSFAQALCCESFSSGHHYWEVDVGDVEWWRVGVAYGTIPRKWDRVTQLLGGSNVSWCLEKRDDNFSVFHGGEKTALSVRGAPSPRRIGLHLHWEGGLLEFYRADSMEVIHEVRQRFLQPLYPGMWVRYCNDRLEIVDLSRAS